jgi:hypothetical protein
LIREEVLREVMNGKLRENVTEDRRSKKSADLIAEALAAKNGTLLLTQSYPTMILRCMRKGMDCRRKSC